MEKIALLSETLFLIKLSTRDLPRPNGMVVKLRFGVERKRMELDFRVAGVVKQQEEEC